MRKQPRQRPTGRLRIAVSRKLPPGMLARISADQALAFDRTARLLAELGHHVVERSPAYGMARSSSPRLFRAVYEDSLKLDPSSAGRALEPAAGGARRAAGRPARRDKLLAKRAATTARILALWDDVDVLLTPGLARDGDARRGRLRQGRGAVAIDIAGRFTPFTPLFNLTGQPAIAVPAGIGSDGLPLSVQLVGRRGAEDVLFALAGQLEGAQPWAERRPPLV